MSVRQVRIRGMTHSLPAQCRRCAARETALPAAPRPHSSRYAHLIVAAGPNVPALPTPLPCSAARGCKVLSQLAQGGVSGRGRVRAKGAE
jgi:hypothetical protein